MCFVLSAGTTKPLPRKKWDEQAPDLCIESLTDHDTAVKQHFSNPEVQYVGSTSGCGCDFPNVTLQNGEWPWFESAELDPERETSDRYNREQLVALLRETGEPTVELYGVWDGAFNFSTPPAKREEIPVEKILERGFRFKEQGFYVVRVK